PNCPSAHFSSPHPRKSALNTSPLNIRSSLPVSCQSRAKTVSPLEISPSLPRRSRAVHPSSLDTARIPPFFDTAMTVPGFFIGRQYTVRGVLSEPLQASI